MHVCSELSLMVISHNIHLTLDIPGIKISPVTMNVIRSSLLCKNLSLPPFTTSEHKKVTGWGKDYRDCYWEQGKELANS